MQQVSLRCLRFVGVAHGCTSAERSPTLRLVRSVRTAACAHGPDRGCAATFDHPSGCSQKICNHVLRFSAPDINCLSGQIEAQQIPNSIKTSSS